MTTHVAVVGAYGSAGVVVAERLASEPDVELTLIDDGDPGGGLCILAGCMPSKELITAAERRFAVREDDRLPGDAPDVDLERVVERKDENISTYAEGRRSHVHELAERDGVTLRRETAEFLGDRRLAVGEDVIEPDYLVIATGSTLNVPPIPGIDAVPFETSRDVLDATEFGDTGLVVGLGAIGLELVPYLSEAAGMDLTAVEMLPTVLPDAAPEISAELVDYYRDEFDVDVRLDTQTKRLEGTADGGVRAVLDDGSETTVEADQLFLFTGRKPALDRLNVDATRLTPEAGWIEDTLQARDDDRVFVVGDANGREPILHVAKEEGAVAAENVLRHRDGRPLEPYENVPHQVVFSGLGDLPYARLGHTAASAREAGLDPIVVTQDVASLGVFRSRHYTDGLARLVVGDDGTVLGYQGLHPDADVMAKTMQVIVEMGLDVREIPDRAYHPTTPEILDGLFTEAAAKLDV
ncbi:MAG: NAD(P)/FAD-dependent oxidoreductase [Haloferacaceae archaeon]